MDKEPTWVSSAGHYMNIELGDVSGDGLIDIVASNGTLRSIDIFINQGGYYLLSPSFTIFPNIQSWEQGEIDLGDYDADGDLDIGYVGRDELGVYKNNGGYFGSTPVWSKSWSYGGGGSYFKWGDINNDGKLDILVTGQTTDLYINTNNTFSNTPDWTHSNYDYQVGLLWFDFDNDGDQDAMMGGGIFENIGLNFILLHCILCHTEQCLVM